MAMRPKNRGFSRKVFDLFGEKKGPMSRSTIAEEMRKMGHPVTSKQNHHLPSEYEAETLD